MIAVVNLLTDAGVGCWLDGGWGVDALIRRQTRPHDDLDLVLAMSDLPVAIGALERDGFAIDEDLRPISFTMLARDGRKVDIHPVTWDQYGSGVQAQPNDSTWTYPARGFAGIGSVAGQDVKCLTAEVQILCHDNYELDAGDLEDLMALRSVLEDEGAEVRERWRDLLRRGYDTISREYRDDHGRPNSSTAEHTDQYEDWVGDLARLLKPAAKVLDLGCGAGVPATQQLVELGFDVTGLDISSVQIERARSLVPGARFVLADMATWNCEPESFDAVVSFYALIHVPLEDQRMLLPRIRRWLRPRGFFFAIVGHDLWTGLENYLDAPMFWDHADRMTYLEWLDQAGLTPVWDRFVPEGQGGHTLVLARRSNLLELSAYAGPRRRRSAPHRSASSSALSLKLPD